MGRIKKEAGPKHDETLPPAIADFVSTASILPIPQLPQHFRSFPIRWEFPKGDVYHWIPLFNRFDNILEQFVREYGLNIGPQLRPFGCVLLLKGVAEEGDAAKVKPTSEPELHALGFGPDGDRQLVEDILSFSRKLLENCGNRSLYASSERLGDLLNTTSLSLLSATLQLAARLAHRYYASRQKGAQTSQHLNSSLLQLHYNIDLEKMQKLANPFTKSSSATSAPALSATPTVKGKEKAHTSKTAFPASVNANDFSALTRDASTSVNGSAKSSSAAEKTAHHTSSFEEWGSVILSYYQSATVPKDDQKPPPTPTPARRPSGLSRPSRLSSSDEPPETSTTSSYAKPEEPTVGGMRQVELPYSQITSSPVEDVLKDALQNLPKDSHYELLTRVRNAKAIATSVSMRQELVKIRLLAITNLAYIYPDVMFQQKILQQDSDQPRRFQIAYQLADLVHPPGSGISGIPLKLQTVALGTLEALAKQKTKASDVCAALNVNVNHGVLFYLLRKAVAEMASEDPESDESEERREAVFSLLECLPPSAPRTGENLIAAGLLDILIEILSLRTNKAERSQPKILNFLNAIVYTVRDALQSIANSKGLDTISDLIAYEVHSSLKRAKNGEGLDPGYRSHAVDYQTPFFQQQTLRMLFKLINHLMANSPANFDRLLRNLIDSPQLLAGLKIVITNPTVFGSSIWSGAINIMSSFIHNEPTSYAVISEAGLSSGLLEAITLNSKPQSPMTIYELFISKDEVIKQGVAHANAGGIAKFMNDDHCKNLRQAVYPSTHEILPASDSITAVPQAFGAICLHNSGLELFQKSGAIDSFFRIFESDEHIKVMLAPAESELLRMLGNSFDELVRHHPTLKMAVVINIMTMIERVGEMCKLRAKTKGCGAKLWLQAEDGKLVPAGEHESTRPSIAEQGVENDHDVVMGEASPVREGHLDTAVLDPEVIDEMDEKNGPSTAQRIEVVMRFLEGFFENSSLCSFFVEANGANLVLDLATLPSLPFDFNMQKGGEEVSKVVHIMVEQKPHLVLPALLQRTQKTLDDLQPLYNYIGEDAFFAEFTSVAEGPINDQREGPYAPIGTTVLKSLVNVHTLTCILSEVFSAPIFGSRSSHTPFSQVNLADMYRDVVKSLGLLHRVCVWEEILLLKRLPNAWKTGTNFKGFGMGSEEADAVFGFLNNGNENAMDVETASGLFGTAAPGLPSSNARPSDSKKPKSPSMEKDEKTAHFKNVRSLRYVLSQIPSATVLFFQSLGKSLVAKRRPEAYARQSAYMVAEAMSNASLEQLRYEPARKSACAEDRYAYCVVVLTSVSTLIIEGSPTDRPSSQVLTLLLQAFKNDGGLEAFKEVLETFFEAAKTLVQSSDETDRKARIIPIVGGIRIILSFFAQITMSKSITESSQTPAITSNERDRGQLTYFLPAQFLVELRMSILPVVKTMWDSDFVDKADVSIIKCLIEILRTVLEGSDEQGAFKRGDQQPSPRKTPFKIYSIHSDKVRSLTDLGYDPEVVQEALYRCQNTQAMAMEYCQALKNYPGASRNPIPEYDQEKARRPASATPRRSESGATLPEPDQAAQSEANDAATDRRFAGFEMDRETVNAILAQASSRTLSQDQPQAPMPAAPAADARIGDYTAAQGNAHVEVEEAGGEDPGSSFRAPPPPAPGVPPETDSSSNVMSIDSLQSILSEIPGRPNPLEMPERGGAMTNAQKPDEQPQSKSIPTAQESPKVPDPVTVNDLDDGRATVRENLIDRALDVLNVHDDVTFELADLIQAAALKSSDAKQLRSEIGETLVQSLISLQMEEDFRPAGKRIASYANLLALVLQDRDFFEATAEFLVENLEQLMGFIKIYSDPPEQASPWIGQILLVIEKVLAEDVQPSKIEWSVPANGEVPKGAIIDMPPPLVSLDAKRQLFEAIDGILLGIGRDESLALSVVRVLVILTRNREIASKLGEKRKIDRLFIMIKLLNGMTIDRLPSTFMLLLRHIVEDEDTMRQIMRSEILFRFETRTGRATDTQSYVKQMYDLVLRSPELFVEVTNEKLEIPRYDSSQQQQILSLKPERKDSEEKKIDSTQDVTVAKSSEDAVGETESQKEDTKSVNGQDEPAEVQKPRATETKAPVVEHPSGVIHYLLSQLLVYKEVPDPPDPHSIKSQEPLTETLETQDIADSAMSSPASDAGASSPVSTANANSNDTKKAEKPDFKPEQHPIYVYRCFLLQCLAELLHCYNRTKIEFINFSRKADPKAMTPSKPRSAILNYLLNDIIPVGTLSHEDTIEYRKKNLTSNWAMSAIVSLCLRTNENGYPNKRDAVDEDDESDLLFVRKFVLEHALKAYRDANASEEHPDVKYARLLDLADLFNRLLLGRLVPASGTPSPGVEGGFQKSIAKLMFEKNFIAALTGSIADIDLNFPPAKRAIKYILRPLKQLTSTAIVLSESSSISSMNPGTTDEDEISSATSVSDMDDGREETPDLFRHSTLGMFEPNRDQESSSESSEGDEEMYDDEYEEGMDYEEGIERDDEVISDEDEDLGEAGPIEGLHGDAGMNVEVVIDGEDDEPSDDDEDQDDSEDMDEDNEIEVIDEITGDSENASLAEGEDEDWQDEDGEDIARYNEDNDLDQGFSQDTQDAESAVRDIVREFGGPEAALQRLEGLEESRGDLAMDLEEGIGGRYMDDVVGHEHDEEDDDDDEEENEDDVDDEDVMFEPEYDDEEPGMPEPPFGWDPEEDPGMPLPRGHHHHHHHHPRRMPDLWSSFPGSLTDPRTHLTHLSSYRSHRPAGVPRSNDDNANPLLQRSVSLEPSRGTRGQRPAGLSEAAASLDDYWVHGMEPGRRPRGMISADSPVSFLNSLIASVGRRGDIGGMGFSAVGGPGGAVQISIGGGAVGSALTLPRDIENLLGGVRGHVHHEPSRVNRDGNPQQAVVSPAVTYQRWQEESRLLFGNAHIEKALRITEHLLRILVPPAVERKKREDEESKRRAEEERQEREKLREERLAQEKAEKEMKEQQEKAEREAREAAAAQAASEAEAVPPEGQEPAVTEDEGAMEGVENTQVEEPAGNAENAEGPASVEEPAAGPSEPTERVRTTIRGRELDITGLGIDMAYLEALPEEIREEVLMSQLAIQRSEAAAAGEEPTDISREFLEALPPEIREELLQQEAQDRRRREREEARRRQQASSGGGPARAEEMDPASFFASLDPALRQNVLMEQDEEMLAQLPEEIAAEARALGGNRPMHRFAGIAGRAGQANGLVRQILDGRPPQPAAKKPPRKQIVQMLDKAGVATLLRLMFVPQQGSSRQSLNGILHDVSRNRQNRAEVISLLLSILQDGSTDLNAIERSFAHLSLRAKQPVTQKTPQPLKRTLTGPMASVASNMEATPLMVIQQCLSALVSLTQYNPHIPAFFLEEHEVTSGIKTKANRKGKAKENRASKFALNALLSLLDRKLIMESSGCMEQLSSLLQSVTHPLTMLLRKDKDKPEEPKVIEAPATQREPTTGPEGVIADEAVQDLAQTTEPSVEESTSSPMIDVQTEGETRQESHSGVTEGRAKEEEAKKPADEKAKKARDLTPPVVPEENLRLVVNILAARECSAKTFRDTLSTINNLSGIPGAKEVFGKGLIEQAQDLGHSILQDLDELAPQIKQAESGTDIQGMALTKFSPASSDQAKLLRVLTALDYLFDQKHTGSKATPAIDSKTNSAESSTPKEDLLTTLYENPTFGSLWNKLSECLNNIRQGDGSLNVATILLPLIEALMVVCKNTTLKDIPLIKAAKEFAITSPPPESFMESLFFKFTEDHRKILNDLVRHNPKLMSGTFSLLVKNPKVLEFDNKRNYFTRRLHSRGTEARHPQPPLQLGVRRDLVFLDSFKNLSYKSGDEIKYGKLSIRFLGEEGVDAGGVTREWFQVLSRQMFNPDYALFIPVASDRTTFHPNKLSKVNEEHLLFFKFIGRIIGKALYEGRALDCHFSRAVYKRILGKTVSIKDMETLDLDYYKSLLWMLENDITEIITETFSVETDDFGVTEVVDLTENGRNIPVTEENKHEYVQLVVEYRLTGSVQAQLEMFLQGFHDIVPPELIAIFNEQELELLISGLPDIDVDDWKNHTEYQNYQASSPQIQWFWRAVRSFDKEERAKLLQFVTGTSKVPLNGFGQLEGMNGFSRFSIHRDYGNKDRLPSSHTCFNQLDLPEYESYEALRQQVYTAVTAGSEYFGFA